MSYSRHTPNHGQPEPAAFPQQLLSPRALRGFGLWAVEWSADSAQRLKNHLPVEVEVTFSTADAALRDLASSSPDLILLPRAVTPKTDQLRLAAISVPVMSLEPADLDSGGVEKLRYQLELIRLRREVASACRQVQDLEELALVGRLTAAVLHEVNNGLDATRRFLRLARREGEDQDPIQTAVTMAGQTVDRTIEIMQSTLDLARLAARHDPLRPLGEVVREATSFIPERGSTCRFKVTLEDEAVSVPASVIQVLINLIRNAERATGGQGVISIESRKTDHQLRVLVKDDGCGFAPEQSERIFEPFFRARHDSPGTGLGLTLSRSIIERAGGRLTGGSEGVGRGATFCMELPLSGCQA